MIRVEEIVVEDMGAIHPTWLDKLRKCEAMGFSEVRGSVKTGDARRIGVLVHEYCAKKLQGVKVDDWEMYDTLSGVGCTDAEINSVFEYMEELDKFEVFAVEESFEMIVGGEKVRGKVDAVVSMGGEVFVLDHKTSRVMGNLDEWEMQGRVYLKWAREKYGAKMFMVGYVFIGKFSGVDYIDEETDGIVGGLMMGLRHSASKGEFLEKFGRHCTWCRLRGQCDTYKSNVYGFNISSMEGMTTRGRWDLLKSVEKAVKNELEKIEKEVLSSEEGIEGFRVKTSTRRKVDVKSVLEVLGIPVELAGIFTVKLGGLDILMRKLDVNKRAEITNLITRETGSSTVV